jgi:hypothetical protein
MLARRHALFATGLVLTSAATVVGRPTIPAASANYYHTAAGILRNDVLSLQLKQHASN